MKIQIVQIKMSLEQPISDLKKKIIKLLGLLEEEVVDYTIVKKSWDARKKQDIAIVYSVIVNIIEKATPKGIDGINILIYRKGGYQLPSPKNKLKDRPVIIGSGPAGLFSALILAENGYRPIVLERGQAVEQRIQDVHHFFQTGELKENSNIQFGEGGAGTYSDGKLNTQVKDAFFRKDKVLQAFVAAGAPEEILYINKPHIGTDFLIAVVKNLREKITALGGEIRFNSCVTDLIIDHSQIQGVVLHTGEKIFTKTVILAIGHSARDTFQMLVDQQIPIEKKAFAIGLRIEHPQEMISKSQFGEAYIHPNLPVADYKLTHRAKNGRGVYTFCMCPGGYVVNSSSEKGGIVCNGMSYFKRDSQNANSAILVNVTPEDFGGSHLLSGVEFQRKWEKKAFQVAGENYQLPVQLFDDFCKNQISHEYGRFEPSIKGKSQFGNLRDCLPPYVSEGIMEGVKEFNNKIKGFSRPDAILTGVETRSSSPIRIMRNTGFESSIQGLYPCGEGAGYAGGIMSAAMDGIRVAEVICDPSMEL